MLNKKGLYLVLILSCFLFLISACGANTPVVDGPIVTIDSGGHHIEGMIQPSVAYQYLMKDEGVSVGTFSGDAFITLLPLATADKLKAQYGDFFNCNDPGALQAIQNLETAILVGGDTDTKQSIAGALSLVRQSSIPAVSFNAAILYVTKHTYMDMEVHDNTGIPIYYLTDFKVLQDDYMEEVK